jgi:hypothetical protein
LGGTAVFLTVTGNDTQVATDSVRLVIREVGYV